MFCRSARPVGDAVRDFTTGGPGAEMEARGRRHPRITRIHTKGIMSDTGARAGVEDPKGLRDPWGLGPRGHADLTPSFPRGHGGSRRLGVRCEAPRGRRHPRITRIHTKGIMSDTGVRAGVEDPKGLRDPWGLGPRGQADLTPSLPCGRRGGGRRRWVRCEAPRGRRHPRIHTKGIMHHTGARAGVEDPKGLRDPWGLGPRGHADLTPSFPLPAGGEGEAEGWG